MLFPYEVVSKNYGDCYSKVAPRLRSPAHDEPLSSDRDRLPGVEFQKAGKYHSLTLPLFSLNDSPGMKNTPSLRLNLTPLAVATCHWFQEDFTGPLQSP